MSGYLVAVVAVVAVGIINFLICELLVQKFARSKSTDETAFSSTPAPTSDDDDPGVANVGRWRVHDSWPYYQDEVTSEPRIGIEQPTYMTANETLPENSGDGFVDPYAPTAN